MAIKPVKIVYCYDPKEDQVLRDGLNTHISTIPYVTTKNYDSGIAGTNRDELIKGNLETADILLLLESANFRSSIDRPKLMRIVEAMLESRQAHVVPVILRPMAWENEYLGALQVLPHNREPITTWADKDDAYLDVSKGVQEIVDIISTNRRRDLLLSNASQYAKDGKYEEALAAYEHALFTFPIDPFTDEISVKKIKAEIWSHIAAIHVARKSQQETLEAYQNVVKFDPSDVNMYIEIAKIHIELSKQEQAIRVCNEAIRLKFHVAQLYILKSVSLSHLGRLNDALATCDQGIEICSDKVAIIRQKGRLLYRSGRYAEACKAYKSAVDEDPQSASTYLYREYGDALFAAKYFEDAAAIYRLSIRVYDRTGTNDQNYVDELEQKHTDAHSEATQERKKNRRRLKNNLAKPSK